MTLESIGYIETVDTFKSMRKERLENELLERADIP